MFEHFTSKLENQKINDVQESKEQNNELDAVLAKLAA